MDEAQTEKSPNLKISEHSYTIVPNALLTNKLLSAGAKLTYITLLKYARNKGVCRPSELRIAEDVGASERYIRDCIKELERRKLITIKRRGQGRTNIYSLCLRVTARSPEGLDGPLKQFIEESGIFSTEEE